MKRASLSVTALTFSSALVAVLSGCKVELPGYDGNNPADAGNGALGSGTASTQSGGASSPSINLGKPVATTTIAVSASSALSATPGVTNGDSGVIANPPDETETDSGVPPIGATASDSSGATSSASETASGSSSASALPSASTTASASVAPSSTSAVPNKDVHGRIVDPYRRPLPNLSVRVGSVNTMTNQNGEFTIPDAPDTYDVEFEIFDDGLSYAPRGWRYVGLTRRDPTLQSLNTSLSARSVNAHITSPLTSTSNEKIALGFGSPEESFGLTIDSATNRSLSWKGPAALNVKGHSLQVHLDNNGVAVGYAAYEDAALSFTDAGQMNWALSLPGATPTGLTSGNITGTVSVLTEQSRTNRLYLAFNSNALVPLFQTTTTGVPNFTHLVPTVPNSSVLLLARNDKNSFDGPEAYAYRTALAVGQTAVTVAIPSPALPTAPAQDATGVNANTDFSWSGSDGVVLFRIWHDSPSEQGNYIVTSQKSIQALKLTALPLVNGSEYKWEVQSHSHCATVDECSDTDGWLDPLYFLDTPNRTTPAVTRDGSFARSAMRYINTAN